MSCGSLALDEAGIGVGTYYASELDKYAIQVAQDNYPDNVQLGDVTKWREWGIDWGSIDLLIGGSPCQGFSFAGKQLAFEDPRSKLFFVYVEILNHIEERNPDVKFLLENVRMKKEHMDVISDYLDVEPVMINSALVSAQNRVRYYWANWEFGQPEDKGIVLADVIEGAMRKKAKTLRVGGRGSPQGSKQEGDGVETTKKPIRVGAVKKGSQGDRIYSEKGKSISLNAQSGGTAGAGNMLVEKKSQTLLATLYKENAKSMVKRKKKGLLVASTDTDFGVYSKEDVHYRKLMPIECERLQTVPDEYTATVSNSQRFKMLGNGWTVNVIAHILSAGFRT